ncbi:hypothetical protein PRIPAC_77842 [Pristionchus pacificus]|uniref:Uncharacterized protein n=1 Tax=Pristionchus pacificus TaxID=54126 RepID=A0A2A6BW76_PRIPA|nr:hypothetical protein PRIPAC_77842 [Pristionchus pacificus]|eukprot:PDM70021.1 hypothetical protein PRIPAC_49233 [Pristionchus pacificus]
MLLYHCLYVNTFYTVKISSSGWPKRVDMDLLVIQFPCMESGPVVLPKGEKVDIYIKKVIRQSSVSLASSPTTFDLQRIVPRVSQFLICPSYNLYIV